MKQSTSTKDRPRLPDLPPITASQYAAFNEAHMLLTANMSYLTGAEFKILSYVISDTYAMGVKSTRITQREFVSGYYDARGYHGGSGLSLASVVMSVKSLLACRALHRTKEGKSFIYQFVPGQFVRAMQRRANPVRKRTRQK